MLPFVRVQIRAVFRRAALPPVVTLLITQHVPEHTIPGFTNRSPGFPGLLRCMCLPVRELTVHIISVLEQRSHRSGRLLTGVWNSKHTHLTRTIQCLLHNLSLCSLTGTWRSCIYCLYHYVILFNNAYDVCHPCRRGGKECFLLIGIEFVIGNGNRLYLFDQ